MPVTVRYIYSACVMISTPDVRILCDPWMTQGIHDGSWFHYPYDPDLSGRIGAADLIFISHIHQDHYDIAFLRQYLAEHPQAKVIIADFGTNFLARKMTVDGIAHTIVGSMGVGDTEIDLVPNHQHALDIDSALVVRHGGHSVLNMNDNINNPDQIARILAIAPEPTIALLPFTGASAYPHTFYDIGPKLLERAAFKQNLGFERYHDYLDKLKPQAVLPFAGQHALGGKLHYLNPYRGNPDPVEVLDLDPRGFLLADGGEAWIDTAKLQPSQPRTTAYDAGDFERYRMSLANRPMDYELTFGHLEVSAIGFDRLLHKAYKTAIERSQARFDYWYCICLDGTWFAMNANRERPECGRRDRVDGLEYRSEIYIDLRYLYGLLTLTYHWNNAEGGSQYFTRRSIDEYNREVNDFMNFLQV